MFAASGFAVTKGEPVVGGLRGPELQHFFCDRCMTWMFTRPTSLPEVVSVRPTLFDDHAWFAPFMETQTKTRLSWARTGAVRSFEAFPSMDTFDELLGEYRAWRAARD